MFTLDVIIKLIKYVLHISPILLFVFHYWLLGTTILVLNFIFYVKTFKLEVYLLDLKEKTPQPTPVKEEIKLTMERWRKLTFINEFRKWNGLKK